jgi:hypothetical protein
LLARLDRGHYSHFTDLQAASPTRFVQAGTPSGTVAGLR